MSWDDDSPVFKWDDFRPILLGMLASPRFRAQLTCGPEWSNPKTAENVLLFHGHLFVRALLEYRDYPNNNKIIRDILCDNLYPEKLNTERGAKIIMEIFKSDIFDFSNVCGMDRFTPMNRRHYSFRELLRQPHSIETRLFAKDIFLGKDFVSPCDILKNQPRSHESKILRRNILRYKLSITEELNFSSEYDEFVMDENNNIVCRFNHEEQFFEYENPLSIYNRILAHPTSLTAQRLEKSEKFQLYLRKLESNFTSYK